MHWWHLQRKVSLHQHDPRRWSFWLRRPWGEPGHYDVYRVSRAVRETRWHQIPSHLHAVTADLHFLRYECCIIWTWVIRWSSASTWHLRFERLIEWVGHMGKDTRSLCAGITQKAHQSVWLWNLHQCLDTITFKDANSQFTFETNQNPCDNKKRIKINH